MKENIFVPTRTRRFQLAGLRNPYMLILLLLILLSGCGPAKKDIPPGPVTFYFVPDWKTQTAEREGLISSLPRQDTFFIYETLPPGMSQPGSIAVPDHSCIREKKNITLIFINARTGIPPVPLDWKKRPPPSYPLIAFIRGQLPDKALARAHERFSPDAYIFLSDHYENMGDVHSVPAFTAGTDRFSSAFTGDFPYVLKIQAVKGDISVRPIDRQGYVLKTDTVTSSRISGLNMLKNICDISLTVKEWEIPFRHTSVLSVSNPFRQSITLTLDLKQDTECKWHTDITPGSLTLKPGKKGELKVTFLLKDIKGYEPSPSLRYSIYASGGGICNRTKKVDVTYYPKPGSNTERGTRNAEIQKKK